MERQGKCNMQIIFRFDIPIWLAETKIADPAAHAKKQVSELDKTAKRSLDKRRFVTEQLEKDEKEIHHIEDQIARINER